MTTEFKPGDIVTVTGTKHSETPYFEELLGVGKCAAQFIDNLCVVMQADTDGSTQVALLAERNVDGHKITYWFANGDIKKL